ncbi:MAG: thiamine phosphate synthase [Bauldia sp.]|nr:thiamine phosphate synthase [Bauldia sp.]
MPGRPFPPTRLCLVTPEAPSPGFVAAFEAAVGAGDVASAIVAPRADGAADEELARMLAPLALRKGCALIVAGDGDAAARLDGAHVEAGLAALRAAVARHHPDRIVGAGGIQSRHDAMEAGEAGADYLFFGRLDGDGLPEIFPRALELAAWWAELFEIPAMVMGGNSIESVGEARAARIEFIALRRAVWDHPDGPAAAVATASRLLAATPGTS